MCTTFVVSLLYLATLNQGFKQGLMILSVLAVLLLGEKWSGVG